MRAKLRKLGAATAITLAVAGTMVALPNAATAAGWHHHGGGVGEVVVGVGVVSAQV
jgi:hypothetical protein